MKAVRASAPTRIDLAGGTLDIWPISVIVPGARTVNLAIELRAEVTVEPRRDDRVVVVSRDRGKRASRKLPLGRGSVDGPLSVVLRLVRAFEPRRGMTLTLRAQAPAGAGLGGSSTLGIAVGGALNRFLGAGLSRRQLVERVVNSETAELRVPTGNQDHLAALHGGLSAYRHGVDGTRQERLPVDRRLAERLVLVYTGQPRRSGSSNWDMFRRFIEGQKTTVARMERIAEIAAEMSVALAERRIDDAGALLGDEGRLRASLAPSVTTPLTRKVAAAARRAGALGVKVCGAGGGGCMVAVATEGRQETVAAAMVRAGAVRLAPAIARRGLVVSER